jgi:hypothetical protein
MAYYTPTLTVNFLHISQFSYVCLQVTLYVCTFFPAAWPWNCICVAQYHVLAISCFLASLVLPLLPVISNNKMLFSRASFWSFLQSKNSARYSFINLHRPLWKVTYFCYTLTKTKLHQPILLKILYIKDHENLSSGSQGVPCRDIIQIHLFSQLFCKCD